MSDKPKRPDDLVDLEIDGHVDSGLTHEQAERIKQAKAAGTFSGFGRVTPLPGVPKPTPPKRKRGD
jgi:hypothetical protein